MLASPILDPPFAVGTGSGGPLGQPLDLAFHELAIEPLAQNQLIRLAVLGDGTAAQYNNSLKITQSR